MIRRDLLSMVLRLGIGFVILVVFGAFLWNRSRRAPSQPQPSSSPSQITIVTPTPTPSSTTLPSVGPDVHQTPSDEKDSKPEKGRDKDQTTDSSPRYKKEYITKTYIIERYIDRHTASPDSRNSVSAYAEAQAGSAWAKAESSAD